jgi:integral membrane protein (TIGR01906 family)
MKNRTSRPWLERLLRWPLYGLVPILLLLTSVRLLLTPAFVRLNYALPGFPEDPYGFTREERLQGANVALEYLLNDQPVSFLGDLRFENGQPAYNDRELKHMEDVKVLVQQAMAVWLAALALGAVLALGLGQFAGERHAWRALHQAARLTLLVMVLLLAGIAASFSFLFVGFHRVFFEGDTWLFLYSDTLIRLFPERFWLTAFLGIGAGTLLLAGLLLGLSAWRLRRLARATSGESDEAPA